MVKRWVVLVMVLAWVLVGCAADPRNQADAYKTRIIAEQAAADRVQLRAAAGQAAALAQAEQEQTSAARVAAEARLITWLAVAGSLAGSLAVIGLGVGLAVSFVGAGRGVYRLAEVRACLIPLAENTRQFPLILAYTGRGRYSLANPNTGGVALLDTRRDDDRQLIAAAGAVQLAGSVAREARRSDDAAGVVPAVNPTVIDLAGSLFKREVISHDRE
jgi:hypothetical protein